MLRKLSSILICLIALTACTPTPRINDEPIKSGYVGLLIERTEKLHSAAYLMDLRVNKDGEKNSVITELYFSGDSVGFYGRGYLGKGTFKGNIIDNNITVYFPDANEYFQNSVDRLNLEADCTRPSEVLFFVMSLLSGEEPGILNGESAFGTRQKLEYQDKRFLRTVFLKKGIFPKKEKLIDSNCGDSILVRYMRFDEDFPYYKVRDILYHNDRHNFKAIGFIREQKYNISLPAAKFIVNYPDDAVRIESF